LISSEWFTTEINKEFYNNMRMAVVAVWTIWGCDMVELSHKFLLIAFQIRPKVIWCRSLRDHDFCAKNKKKS
jgi:hypothetical protein